MKRLIIEPTGWPCSLRECPPGLFVHNDIIGFKSVHPGMRGLDKSPPFQRYQLEEGNIDVYLTEGGSHFWGGTDDQVDLQKLEVQPCSARWEEDDD